MIYLGLTLLLCDREDEWNPPLGAIVGLEEGAHMKQTQALGKHHHLHYLFIHN